MGKIWTPFFKSKGAFAHKIEIGCATERLSNDVEFLHNIPALKIMYLDVICILIANQYVLIHYFVKWQDIIFQTTKKNEYIVCMYVFMLH